MDGTRPPCLSLTTTPDGGHPLRLWCQRLGDTRTAGTPVGSKNGCRETRWVSGGRTSVPPTNDTRHYRRTLENDRCLNWSSLVVGAFQSSTTLSRLDVRSVRVPTQGHRVSTYTRSYSDTNRKNGRDRTRGCRNTRRAR